MDSDRRLAKHLVSLYYSGADNAGDNGNGGGAGAGGAGGVQTVDQDFLRDYIAYARATVAPDFDSRESNEAVEVLVRGYLAMRAMGGSGSKTITATPRQLESLIRISQALAKMRLSAVVSVEDVHEAIRLMRVATQTAATDPRTGTIDMDMISTGRGTVDRDLVLKLAEQLSLLFAARKGQRMSLAQIRQTVSKEMSEQTLSQWDVEEAVRELEADGVIQYVEHTQTVIIR